MKKSKPIILSCFILLLMGACVLPFLKNENSSEKIHEPVQGSSETVENTPVVETLVPVGETLAAPQVIDSNNVSSLKLSVETGMEYPSRLKWFNDSSKVSVFGQDKLMILNSTTLLSEGSIEFSPSIFSLEFSPETNLVASTSDQLTLELRQVIDGKTVGTISPAGSINNFDFSPSGKLLIISSAEELSATIWDVNSLKEVKKLTGFETAAPVYSVSFGSNDQTVIWSARAGIQMMDVKTGDLGKRFDHEDFISSFALSSDGTFLATAAGGTINGEFSPLITIWNNSTGNQAVVLQPDHLPSGSALAFSPDGKILASGSDANVIFWNVTSGDKLFELQPGGDMVSSISFSPDGKRIGLTSIDGKVKIFQAGP